jgi:hypothetical protein
VCGLTASSFGNHHIAIAKWGTALQFYPTPFSRLVRGPALRDRSSWLSTSSLTGLGPVYFAGQRKGRLQFRFREFGSSIQHQILEASSRHRPFETISEEQKIPRNTFHVVPIRLTILFQASFLFREDFEMSPNHTKDHECEC